MTAVFPALPGLGWSVTKAPRFQSRIQRAVSGRELRVLDQPNPVWSWTLKFEILRDAHDVRGPGGFGAGYDELRTLMGFYLEQQGAFSPFLFDDPTDDSTAATQGIINTVAGGFTGDGTTKTFQLARSMPGFTEPITAPNQVGAVTVNGILTSGWSVDPATGILTFAVAPAAGASVAAQFTYYFRVRFADDSAEFENFMYQLWSLKQVKLQSVLP